MSEWREMTLGDVCSEGGGLIRTGPFGAQLHQSDYVSDGRGIPVLMPKDMKVGRVDLSTIARIDEATADRLAEHLLAPGDIALSRRGDVGRTAWIGPDDTPILCGTGSMRVSPGDSTTVRPEYLRFFLRSQPAIDYLRGQAVGSTMPNLNTGIVAAMPIPVLPEEEQHLAAAVLTQIEDLIENNRRRIDVLERMAHAIYREWFVHFRYPGHGEVEIIDSDLGRVPDGWAVSTCGGELSVLGGGTPSKREPAYWDCGTIPWFTPSDLTKSRVRATNEPALRITDLGLEKSSARLFPAGSVMMTSRATLGVLAIATTEASCNQGFIVIPPDDRWPPTFIYEWLRTHADELEALGTGATFKEITKSAFKRHPFLVPTQSVLDAFASAVMPVEEGIRSLEAQVRVLADLRDLVLPQLVTGQVDVSTLDLDELVGQVT